MVVKGTELQRGHVAGASALRALVGGMIWELLQLMSNEPQVMNVNDSHWLNSPNSWLGKTSIVRRSHTVEGLLNEGRPGSWMPSTARVMSGRVAVRDAVYNSGS